MKHKWYSFNSILGIFQGFCGRFLSLHKNIKSVPQIIFGFLATYIWKDFFSLQGSKYKTKEVLIKSVMALNINVFLNLVPKFFENFFHFLNCFLTFAPVY